MTFGIILGLAFWVGIVLAYKESKDMEKLRVELLQARKWNEDEKEARRERLAVLLENRARLYNNCNNKG
jgi:hypothetical protein